MRFVLYQRSNTQRAAILDDLLELASTGKQAAVNMAITMLTDLYAQGHQSSYAQKMKSLPIWELKSRTRGGAKGGIRIYFYFRSNGDIVIVNAEAKPGTNPNVMLLKEATHVAVMDKERK